MENIGKEFLEIIETWINTTQKIIQSYSNFPPLAGFIREYHNILQKAKIEIWSKEKNISTLKERIENNRDPQEILNCYEEVMTFRIDKKELFLPSFSDECLKELTKSSLFILSPFRGLYYGWKLGEIYRLFEKGKNDIAISDLLSLMKEVELNKLLQSSKNYYLDYMEAIENASENLHPSLDIQISTLKKAMREIVFKIKAKWLGYGFPYSALTSTHFYLSGIRFYLNPLILQDNVEFKGNERFYVQSTDSGLYKIEEHYGTILNSVNLDEMA